MTDENGQAQTHRRRTAAEDLHGRATYDGQVGVATLSAAKIVGKSPALRETLSRARRVAKTDVAVLISGETGTGKELLAHYVHSHSLRKDDAFVAINCAAIPAELLEAELFGHARGAFTGARNAREGLFEAANGGTLFLDEIGEMPAVLQSKLLRVLQEGEIRSVGSTTTKRVDVRVLSATHCTLTAMVDAKSFRADLYYRLKGYALRLPPLRERRADIIQLARHFLRSSPLRGRTLAHDARQLLCAYPWPGNVRELQNTLIAAAIDSNGKITAKHLTSHLDEVPRKEVAGLERCATASLTSRQALALERAATVGRITRRELEELAGVSSRTANRDLKMLLAGGLLTRDGGKGIQAGYVPTESATRRAANVSRVSCDSEMGKRHPG